MKYLCLYVGVVNVRLDVTSEPVSYYGLDIFRVVWFSKYSEELHLMWSSNLKKVRDIEFELDLPKIFRIIDSLNSSKIVTFTYQAINQNLQITESRYKGYLHSVDGPAEALHSIGADLGEFDRQKHISYRYYEMGVLRKHQNKTPRGYSVDYYSKNSDLVKSEYYEPELRLVDWEQCRPVRFHFLNDWCTKVSSTGIYTLRQSPKENVLELVRNDKIVEIRMPVSFVHLTSIAHRFKLPRIIVNAIIDDLTTVEDLTSIIRDPAKFYKCFKIRRDLSSEQMREKVREIRRIM